MSAGSISPWLVDGHLVPVSSHGLPSICADVLISSSYEDTSHIGLDPTIMISFYFNYFFKH